MTKNHYEDYKNKVNKIKDSIEDVDENNYDNFILLLKSAACDKFKEERGNPFVCSKENFGFTERVINYLMQVAFNEGRKSLAIEDVVLKAVEQGRQEKTDELIKFLGLTSDG